MTESASKKRAWQQDTNRRGTGGKSCEKRHKKRLLPGWNFAEHIKKAAKAGNNAKSRTKKKCCFPKKEPVKTCYFRDIAESFSVFF